MRLRSAVLCLTAFAGSLAAQSVNPCALVTKAEVQQAVGSPVSDGVVNTTNMSVCDFKVGASGSMLSVTLASKGPADTAERIVAELKKRNISAQTVPGIGDGAYASSPGYGMQQLGAFKGSNQVIVTALIMGAPEAKVRSAMQAVMIKALAKVK